jgi:multisubunit Na+/H+ antiporter MnhG subunit
VTAGIIAVLLAVVVGATWLGCFGFARLRTPLDRLHCVAFVNFTAGTALTIAAFVADGPSTRAFKILLMTLLSLAGGAALSHATGRALWMRDRATKGDQT